MPDDAQPASSDAVSKLAQLIRTTCYSNVDDYTFYPARDSEQKSGDALFNEWMGNAARTARAGHPESEQSGEKRLQYPDGDKEQPTSGRKKAHFSYDCVVDGGAGPRLLACRSFQGRYWSITGRGKQEQRKGTKKVGQIREALGGSPSDFVNSGYAPRCPDKDFGELYLFPVANIVEMIVRRLELGQKRQHGLVVISGATKSGKSLLARGLVHSVLKEAAKTARKKFKHTSERSASKKDREAALATVRRPHLVTFEDPIEKWFWEDTGCDGRPAPVENRLLDYTPRQRGIDAPSLEAALRDALRQTPTVFYIGEIRREKEWAAAIEFAGTGHLVVATAHAGSLTETVVRICRALNAVTPAQRNYVADRLAGVVHMRLETQLVASGLERACGGNQHMADRRPDKALVGSLWMGTPSGVHALTSGGFTSVLWADGEGCKPDARPGNFCLGESWWVRTQLRMLSDFPTSAWGLTEEALEDFRTGLVRALMHRHLETE